MTEKMKTSVIKNDKGFSIIHVNKQTHRLRIENDTEEGADVIIERISPLQEITLDLSKPVHTFPSNEEGGHLLSDNCECQPTLEDHGDYQLYAHNEMLVANIEDNE